MKNLATAISILAFAVLLWIWGFSLGYTASEMQSPNCPEEDSCYPDYYNGEWHILPVEQELLPN